MRMATAIPAVVCLFAGCSSRKPVQMVTPETKSTMQNWVDAVQDAIKEKALEQNLANPKERRNYAIAYTEAAIMSRYGALRNNLMRGRATTSIAFEILELGLTTSVPIVNGERGKTILGALASGFKGTQLSIDRNLFSEQTTGAILSAMDTCILRQRRLLRERRSLPADEYFLYDAYADLTTMFGCTTLAGAVQELSETQAAAARVERRVIAPVSEEERDDFETIQKQFISSLEGDKVAAVAFLTGMKVENISTSSSADELRAAYRNLRFQALTDSTARAKFMNEAQKAGLAPTR